MIVKLGDIARECKCTSDNKECPIVGLEHLEPKELLLKNYSTDPNTTFTKAFKAGQILFGRRRSYQQKASVATFDGICSGDITIIEAIPGKVEPRLLPFIIQNEAFFNYSIIGSAGGLSPRVKWQHLANYEFDLPSLDEQKVLADKLWAAYEVKESYKNLLAQTDKVLEAKFVNMFGDVQNKFNGFPTKRLGEIGTFLRGGGFQKDDFVEDGIPCIHYGQIHTTFGPFIYKHVKEISKNLQSKAKLAKPGDLIIAITSEDDEGSCKSTAWLGDYDVAVGAHAAIFHHNQNPIYVSYYFKSRAFYYEKIKYTRGSKVVEIKPDDIAKIIIPIPPISHQKQFADLAIQSEKTKASLNKGIEAIEAVIRSLIAEGTTKA